MHQDSDQQFARSAMTIAPIHKRQRAIPVLQIKCKNSHSSNTRELIASYFTSSSIEKNASQQLSSQAPQ